LEIGIGVGPTKPFAMFTGLICVLALWYAGTSASMPESGLEKAAAASAVIAGSDSSSTSGQQQTDLETRLKRITDTLHRVRGPELESERLVVADRAPSYQAGAAQSPFMMRNDEMASSGDGAVGDDDEGDDGEFGSGDRDVVFGADGNVESFPGGYSAPSTEGVYPADLDEPIRGSRKEETETRKPSSTSTTKRPAAGRSSTSGTTPNRTSKASTGTFRPRRLRNLGPPAHRGLIGHCHSRRYGYDCRPPYSLAYRYADYWATGGESMCMLATRRPMRKPPKKAIFDVLIFIHFLPIRCSPLRSNRFGVLSLPLTVFESLFFLFFC